MGKSEVPHFFIDHAVCRVQSSQCSTGNLARFEGSYFLWIERERKEERKGESERHFGALPVKYRKLESTFFNNN